MTPSGQKIIYRRLSDILFFSACTFRARDTYSVSCSTELSDDINPANDTASSSIFVRVLDVGVIEIIQPICAVDSTATIIPKVKMKNFGNTSVSFPVGLRIINPVGAVWSNAQFVNNHLPNSVQVVSFASWLVGQRGNYLVKCSTALTNDQVRENNQLTDTFTVVIFG